MQEIKNSELENISGGLSPWVYFGIGEAIVLLIGVVDGYTRPLKCN